MADLAIVGGGPASVALLHRLARSGPSGRPGLIDVFDKGGRLGPGSAYAPPDPALLMNTPVAHLDITGEPGHLDRWLGHQGKGVGSRRTSHLSRRDYGHYLRHVGASAVEALERSCSTVTFRVGEIVDLVPVPLKGFALVDESGARFHARKVVLAIGDPAPYAQDDLVNQSGYIDSPGRFADLAAIPGDASVIVLGAGASAVDQCLYLKRHLRHKGLVTLVSRTGQLPCVLSDKGPATGAPRPHVSALLSRDDGPLALAEVIEAIKLDLSLWLGQPIVNFDVLRFDKQPARAFRRDVLRAERGLPGPQDYMRSLRDVAPVIWQRLSPSDRELFHKDHRVRWDKFRHPIPLGAARPLMQLLHRGEVRLVRAATQPRWCDGKFVIFDADRVTSSAAAPYLVVATGFGLDAERDRSALVGALLSRNLGLAHPGGGLQVDPGLRLRAADGSPRDIFLMGIRTRGATFATASIRSVARAGEIVAAGLTVDHNTIA